MSRRPRFPGLLRFLTRPPVRTSARLGGDVVGLEERVVPAYTFTQTGTAASLIGDAAASDTLVIDQSGGLLRHNRDSAGDANLDSDFDWNSAVGGIQTLSATDPAVTVLIDMGGGNDTLRLGSATAAATTLAATFNLNAGGLGNDRVIVDDTARATPAAWNYTNGLVTVPGFNFNNQAILEDGEQYNLGSGGNTFTVTSQTNTLAVTGGSGADTLTIPAGPGTALRSFAGGGGADRLVLAAGMTLNGGTFDGGSEADTIDYTAYTTPVAVNLGLGTSGLTAALDGGQASPSNGSAATGTATVTNYNAQSRTFDLTLTVTGIAPANVTGLNLRRGGLGVNGPILLDLQAMGTLVPAGNGFTLTLTGLDLDNSLLGGAANEASFLGGQTYLNVQTAAFPNGLIRGQLFSVGNSALGTGAATGTAGVSSVENAVGGSAADSLVGNSGVNVLNGLGGNDTILGGPGAAPGDTFLGGADDDTLIWSNGDGTDVMDGEAGTDTVAVNGNLSANDVFTIAANGSRLDFDRVSPGAFSLDIGTVETLRVAGGGGDDTFTVSALATVTGLQTVQLFGLAGGDTFTVTPSTVAVGVNGGAGSDNVTVDPAGATNPFLTSAADPAGGRAGDYSFSDRAAVTLAQTETFQAPGNLLAVTADTRATAVAGEFTTYTVTVTNNSAVGLGGVGLSVVIPPQLLDAFWFTSFGPGTSGTASGAGDIDELVNVAAGGVATYYITGRIEPDAAGIMNLTATAAAPAGLTDTDPDDNVATATTNVLQPGVGSAALAVGGGPGNVAVFVPSGGTFGTPTTLTPFAGFAGGVRTATGDVNGDGTPDGVFVTGPGTPLRVTVISGADNTTVLVAPFDPFGGNFPGGGYVAAGDMDGDGNAEFVVTPDEGGGPRVTVFSRNADGSTAIRANFFGIDDDSFRGGARAALGDVNRDGNLDVVVAAGFGGGPRTAIFGGPSVLAGSPIRLVGDFLAFPGADAETLRNGSFVATGDVTGDGFADLIFGGGPGGAPRVFILSGAQVSAGDVAGAQAAPVANFFVAGNTNDRGGVRVAIVNADGDTRADVVVGSGAGSPANVRAYLGKDFTGGGEPGAFQDITVFGGAALPGGVFVG